MAIRTAIDPIRETTGPFGRFLNGARIPTHIELVTHDYDLLSMTYRIGWVTTSGTKDRMDIPEDFTHEHITAVIATMRMTP